MSPLVAPILSGLLAMVATMAAGYFVLAKLEKGSRVAHWKNPLPVIAGAMAGYLLLALMVRTYAPDRFYTPAEAISILAAAAVACVIIWSVEIVAPRIKGGTWIRTAAHVVSQTIAATIVVWAGVKFDLLKVPGEGVTTLGQWSPLFTVLWLVMATNVVRLLDGIHGAASASLLVAALAALYSNVLSREYFLAGFSLVAVGCAVGSMRFCLSENRLPLEGAGTALIGFLFAMLTVMARQKSVATLLFLVPLVLVVLIAGAAMLGLLEKRLLLPRNSGNRKQGRVKSEDI